MKFRFKLIAFIILALLVLVCGYQIYWLINFHNEQYKKMEAAISNAMTNADFKEIALRITGIHELRKNDSVPLQDLNGIMDDLSNIQMPDVVVRIKSNKDSTNIWSNANEMNVSIQQGFHSTIDTLKTVDFIRFDSILQAELSQLEINIPHYLEYKDNSTDSIIMRFPENISDKELAKYEEYKFPFSENEAKSYHLYLKNPKWYIFKDMWGLVLVSVIMIILLILSYIYLLRIILRQKTVDEIKSDFVNNMTHELKTPISVTYAAIDALQNFGIGDDPQKRDEYLTISKEQLIYLTSLVEQILTMSVEERENLRLHLEDINIKGVFENNKSQFLLNATKKTAFRIDIEPENLIFKADKLHFGNIISNLIENAVKYSGESVEIRLSAKKEGNKIIIIVSDNGIGIPKGAQERIFDKFYRVSTGNIHDVKGYGLGLFYVKTIVDKHGWEIKVDSTEGKGTSFKIIIP